MKHDMNLRTPALAALAFLVGLLVPTAAFACGGFFCSNQPMEQAGEKIVFVIDGESVTATIQIQFAGEAEDFSWVLPLPAEPLMEGGMTVGSEELFNRLISYTRPTFEMDWSQNEGCQPWWGQDYNYDYAGFAEPASEPESAPSVTVLQTKQVGPYDAAVVESDDPQALSAWLAENDYDQPPEADSLIAHYVAQDNVFLALKLSQNKGQGDIAPITVKFNEPSGACIPLILTQIAATEDMPVFAWVLDEARTLPKNFFHVKINWAKIDWFNDGDNYVDVVTAAVNEAAGHGFVTDYAGSSDIMEESIFWEGKFSNIDQLAQITDPASFYDEMFWMGLPVNSQTQALIKKHIPPPADFVGDDFDFYCCLYQYEDYLATLDFDPQAFVDEIKEVIIEPMQQAQEMLDSKPYLTRIFTTISPDEMNRDPVFVTSADLPDVPLEHVAMASAVCETGEDGQEVITSIQLTLEDGNVVQYEGEFPLWDYPPELDEATVDGGSVDDQPAAGEIALVTEEGNVRVIAPDQVALEDNNLAIGAPPSTSETLVPDTVVNDKPFEEDPTKPSEGETVALEQNSDDDGCNNTRPLGAASLGLLLMALLMVRCRRQV